MKISIDNIKMAEIKEIDISPYLTVDEPVKIKIRHLTTKKRNEVIALMLHGQEMSGVNKDNIRIENTEWLDKSRMIELLNGVVVDDEFPFEKWDEDIINKIDERNPELINFIHKEIQEFNRPLAEKNNEK